ncbi:MAG: nitroreductase [Deltaproteobacteria bacterium]|nr:nitroreductase [Deltaproteobacteria bacterium]
MDLQTALRRRHSTRQFSKKPVDDAVIDAILDDARHAPSWSNTQPWRVAVANGSRCDALRHELIAASSSRAPSPDYPQLFEYPPLLQARRRATGYGLYAKLGIARDDKEARGRQFEKNFAMFDAPAAVFLYAHKALEHYAVLDAGCFLQSLLLSATSKGVQTCAQAVLGSFPDVVKRHFDVDDDWLLLCGVALGYEADDVVNTFQPDRISVEELKAKPRE